jgi:hypothetical protein
LALADRGALGSLLRRPGAPCLQAALEVLLQQLTAAKQELHEMAGGDGPEFDLQEHLPRPAPAAAGQQQHEQQAAEEQEAAVPMAE